MSNFGFVKSLTFGIGSFSPEKESHIPGVYDLRDELDSPINQGERGICVSACVTDMIRYRSKILGRKYTRNEDFFWKHRSDKTVDGMSPRNAFDIAQAYSLVQSYATIKSAIAAKAAILANGPVLIALPVYSRESRFFWVGSEIQGYHAVTLVGYYDNNQEFILRNSWGTEWADGGYSTLPYSDFTKALEAWTIFS